MEANIYALAVDIHDPECGFNQSYFDQAPNSLSSLLPDTEDWDSVLKLIDVSATSAGRELTLIMEGDRGKAVAFFKDPDV